MPQSVSLRFKHPASLQSPVELRTGDPGGEAVATVDAVLAATIDLVPVSLGGELSGNVLLDLPDAAGPAVATAHAVAPTQITPLATRFAPMRLARSPGRWRHAAAQPLPVRLATSSAQLTQTQLGRLLRHATARPLAARLRSRETDMRRHRRRLATSARPGHILISGITSVHADYIRFRHRLSATSAHGVSITLAQRLQFARGRPTADRLCMPHASMLPVPVGWWQGTYPWPPVEPPEEEQWPPGDFAELRFRWLVSHRLRFGFPPAVPPVPVRRVYIVIPDVIVTRLGSGQPIACSALEISLDADSHTWAAQLTLTGRQAIDELQPDGPADPVILAAHVNGYDWHISVDHWTESVQWGVRGARVTGRGLTAELSQPWALPGSGQNAQGTIQQAFAGLLDAAWTVGWDVDVSPWIVPAGAWSWTDQTPIGAMHAAAQELGLMLVPDRTSRQLTVRARYPVLPWEYSTTTPTVIVPEQALSAYQRQQPTPSQANAVFAHGGEPGGVIGQAVRSGTAGDRAAPTVRHPTITHIDAVRVAARRVLAAQYAQPPWRSMTLPLGGDFPLIEIGDLVEIAAGDQTARVTPNAVKITAQQRRGSAMSVRQQISLGEQTPNPWARFAALLPGQPTYLAEAIANHGQTTTVELLTGQQIRVRGNASIGDKVYVQNGQITGTAPNLPSHQITV